MWRSIQQVQAHLEQHPSFELLHCEFVLHKDPFDQRPEDEWSDKVADTLLAVSFDVHWQRACSKWPSRILSKFNNDPVSATAALKAHLVQALLKVAGPPGTRRFGIAQLLVRRQ